MNEHDIQAQIFREIGSRRDTRIFRNNNGVGWVGRLVRRNPDGSVLIANARPLHAGLFTGSADLMGWRTGVINESDIGHPFARFLSIEVKTGTGKISPEQRAWRDAVNRAGGLGIIARCVEDAMGELDLSNPRP